MCLRQVTICLSFVHTQNLNTIEPSCVLKNQLLPDCDACDAVIELCETHFQCAVCNELLVRATGLGCGHIFCRDCVNKWKRKSESTPIDGQGRRKRATCPICRTEIATQSALKNIDSFLERAVDVFFNDDAKKARKELLSTAITTAPSAQTSLASASSTSASTPSFSSAATLPPLSIEILKTIQKL